MWKADHLTRWELGLYEYFKYNCISVIDQKINSTLRSYETTNQNIFDNISFSFNLLHIKIYDKASRLFWLTLRGKLFLFQDLETLDINAVYSTMYLSESMPFGSSKLCFIFESTKVLLFLSITLDKCKMTTLNVKFVHSFSIYFITTILKLTPCCKRPQEFS